MELQANASSIETELGEDDNGYLGLVLTDAEYASVPNIQSFIVPAYLAALNILAYTTTVKALQLKDKHAESKRVSLECKNIEKVLLRYIQDSMEDKYTEALVNEHMNLLSEDISIVLTYLLYNYGKSLF